MPARESVKVIHAALDEVGDNIVLRGVISSDSFPLLEFGDYQREVLPRATIEGMMEAMKRGSVPDIDVGVRGGDFVERDGAYYIKEPCFVVDGKQRVTAALRILSLQDGGEPRLGATFHFNSNEKLERERFRVLNMHRAKVSPNVLLRNFRHDAPVINAMYGLSNNDKEFVLKGRVCWNQGMQRDHLITALTFGRAIGWLHSHLGPGRSTGVDEIVRGLSVIGDKVGPHTIRSNVRRFFEVVDQCWGIRAVAYRDGATHLRANFLTCLAFVFSRHEVFWNDMDLTVNIDWVRKLKLFRTGDPSVAQLAAGSGKAREILYTLMVNHLNSGKRTQRLKPRDFDEADLASQAGAGGEPGETPEALAADGVR